MVLNFKDANYISLNIAQVDAIFEIFPKLLLYTVF